MGVLFAAGVGSSEDHARATPGNSLLVWHCKGMGVYSSAAEARATLLGATFLPPASRSGLWVGLPPWAAHGPRVAQPDAEVGAGETAGAPSHAHMGAPPPGNAWFPNPIENQLETNCQSIT